MIIIIGSKVVNTISKYAEIKYEYTRGKTIVQLENVDAFIEKLKKQGCISISPPKFIGIKIIAGKDYEEYQIEYEWKYAYIDIDFDLFATIIKETGFFVDYSYWTGKGYLRITR